MTTGTGSAREIPPGRLSNFEDIPIADAPAPLLPLVAPQSLRPRPAPTPAGRSPRNPVYGPLSLL